VPDPAGAPGPPDPAFRVVGSEVVSRPGFLTVDRVTVESASGERFGRTVVRHPGAVVMVPVLPDGRTVLLVRQFRAAVGRELLEAPAGKRDVDGEPPEQTARRELAEEIGYEPERLVLLAEAFNSPGFCDEHTTIFAALGCVPSGAPDPVGPEERAMTVERVALADVPALVAAGEVLHATSVIGLLLAERLLTGGDLGA